MKKNVKSSDSKASAENVRANSALDSKGHKDVFAKAMKAFSKGDFRTAKGLFDSASDGPEISVNESARMYSRMCVQRLQKEQPALHTADEYYAYGVSLLNLRRHSEAAAQLRKAVELGDASHIRYALALAYGMDGDMASAALHLQRAIDLDPATRSHARADSDFQPLLSDAAIRELIHGAKTVES